MASHPEVIELFFALSSFPMPLIVLPADLSGWDSAPPVPRRCFDRWRRRADGSGSTSSSCPRPMIGRRAKTWPVLGDREGRSHVVTIHPALPDVDDDAVRRVLTRLLQDYTERFPEQCYSLAFDAPAGTRA